MEAAARAQPASAGPVHLRREPEKTALYKVMQEHLLTFEQQWTDQANGRTLPKFVTEELHKYMDCGILGRGFAHLFCKTCHEHHAVAFSCKGRAVCPSCLGRRMNEGALNLTDYVLPDVPLRQFVLTMPFPLRFPLAFDGKLLGQVVRSTPGRIPVMSNKSSPAVMRPRGGRSATSRPAETGRRPRRGRPRRGCSRPWYARD